MTINDQIRNEKLQYGLNREAAKMSALSSVKIHKYEYLTGEEILPSNQQQIIGQAKCTYSPLGKAFEKQIKTIEDQGNKHNKTIKKYPHDAEDTPLVSKRKEIFNELVDERLDLNFDEFVNALVLIDKIRDGKISLIDVKNNQEKFKSYLREIKKGNNKSKLKEQKKTLYNIETIIKQEMIIL